MDSELAVIYCQDGKVYIENSAEFVDVYSVFHNKAKASYKFEDALLDVQMDQDLISFVLPDGNTLLAVRRSDFYAHELQFDLGGIEFGSVAPKLMGGKMSNFFITLFIQTNGQQFLQVHSYRYKGVQLVAAINSQVINYGIHENINAKNEGFYYLYAV